MFVVPEFVAAPGCWVQPFLLIPGPAGPVGDPIPVDVLPVPALPCAWAPLVESSAVAITAIALIKLELGASTSTVISASRVAVTNRHRDWLFLKNLKRRLLETYRLHRAENVVDCS